MLKHCLKNLLIVFVDCINSNFFFRSCSCCGTFTGSNCQTAPCTTGADGAACLNSGTATGTFTGSSTSTCSCSCSGTFTGSNCQTEPITTTT